MGDIALALVVHLGDQRAGGVQHRQAAVLGGLDHRLGHAMGAEHRDGAFGHFVQFLDKARALVLQRVDHMLVVDDLVAHIDRLAILIERLLHDIDGANDAGAEAARLGKNDSHVCPIRAAARRPRQDSSRRLWQRNIAIFPHRDSGRNPFSPHGCCPA